MIGTGAFSSVWKGTWNGQIVAIKDVNYHNEREIEMWRREVQILGYVLRPISSHAYTQKVVGETSWKNVPVQLSSVFVPSIFTFCGILRSTLFHRFLV